MNSPKRVMVGLSGGVDSAVAAFLLKRQGYAVEALFMKNWEEDDREGYCSAAEDLADAQQVADRLGIKLHTVNFSAEYWDRVFTHFLNEYRAGRTPNPDILCNREIKFKAFLDHALDLGADCIATGHYARCVRQVDRYYLMEGIDSSKDQSYFLYTLHQHPLSQALFPLGELHKTEVREIARQQGFANSAKKDSTGICFIGERHFQTFLSRYIPAQPGEIQTSTGDVIGKHNGLMYYTLGQRKGLGIGGQKNGDEAPWFVVEKQLDSNTLIVAQGHNHPKLYRNELLASELHWVQRDAPSYPFRAEAKVRYRQQQQPCSVYEDEIGCRVEFDQPQWAITEGQSVVFYQGARCLGGGIIQ